MGNKVKIFVITSDWDVHREKLLSKCLELSKKGYECLVKDYTDPDATMMLLRYCIDEEYLIKIPQILIIANNHVKRISIQEFQQL